MMLNKKSMEALYELFTCLRKVLQDRSDDISITLSWSMPRNFLVHLEGNLYPWISLLEKRRDLCLFLISQREFILTYRCKIPLARNSNWWVLTKLKSRHNNPLPPTPHDLRKFKFMILNIVPKSFASWQQPLTIVTNVIDLDDYNNMITGST